MRKHIRDRMPKDLYDDLVNRRKTVREVAKVMGVHEAYLSHAIPERAPKRNIQLVRVTRRMYQDQLAREVLTGKRKILEAANMAHVSERTMFRRMAKLRQLDVILGCAPLSQASALTVIASDLKAAEHPQPLRKHVTEPAEQQA